MSTRSAFSDIGYSAPSLCKKVVRRRWTPPAAGEGDRLRNPFAFTPGQKDDVFLKKIMRLFFSSEMMCSGILDTWTNFQDLLKVFIEYISN